MQILLLQGAVSRGHRIVTMRFRAVAVGEATQLLRELGKVKVKVKGDVLHRPVYLNPPVINYNNFLVLKDRKNQFTKSETLLSL
jgi:hypothetical protein